MYIRTSTDVDYICVFFIDLVAVAPVATISPKPSVTVSEGNSAVVMCTATGVPAPTISWSLNEVLLSDDGTNLLITSSTDNTTALLSVTSTLNVTSVTRESAFATITCTASNGVGAHSFNSTQIIVLCKSLLLVVANMSSCNVCCAYNDLMYAHTYVIIPSTSKYFLIASDSYLSHLVAPSVTSISSDQEVTSPAPVSFNCTVNSCPSSNITWLYNGAEVQTAPPRVTISTVQVNNTIQESILTLLNTTAGDAGTYICSAENDEGMTITATELQVLGEYRQC